MIRYENVKKSFGNTKVLKGIDLFIQKGETAVILGGSGSGKSVLTSMLVGLLIPDSGRITIDEREIPRSMQDKSWRDIWHKVGYLFQGGALFDSYTVFENISFPLMYGYRISKKEIEDKVMGLLSLLNIEHAKDKYPSELSGGMQKRVSLARSVASDPEIIIYDEPTTGLDPVTSDIVGSLIIDMKKEFNVTSIVVSHDIRLTRMIADRIFFLNKGIIEFSGDIKELGTAPDALKEFFEV